MSNDEIRHHRSRSNDGPREAELRGMVPMELMVKIDALMQANGLHGRMDVVIPVLQKYVDDEFMRATVLLRIAGVNPLQRDGDGKGRE